MSAVTMPQWARLIAGGLLAGALSFGTAVAAFAADPVVKTPATAAPKPVAVKPAPPANAEAAPKVEEAAPIANAYVCITNSCSTQKMLTQKSEVNPDFVDVVNEISMQNFAKRLAASGMVMSDKDMAEIQRVSRETLVNALAADLGGDDAKEKGPPD